VEYVAPPSPKSKKRSSPSSNPEEDLNKAAKRLKVTPSVAGSSLPVPHFPMGPSDEELEALKAERLKQLEALKQDDDQMVTDSKNDEPSVSHIFLPY
jgi:hypothetical protein